jgi:hypothetical protein
MKEIILLLIQFSFAMGMLAQNIAISDLPDHTAHPSAVLDVFSISRGFLVPRLTLFQRESIILPAKGLLIFQTGEEEGFYYNAGTPDNPLWAPIGKASKELWERDSTNHVTYLSNSTDSVGIGLSDPSHKLDVSGGVKVGGKLYLVDVPNDLTHDSVLTIDNGVVKKFAFNAGTADSCAWNWSGNYVSLVNLSDSVGIGILNPSRKLEVKGDAKIDGGLILTYIPDDDVHDTVLTVDGGAIKKYALSNVTGSNGWTASGSRVYLSTSTDSVGIGTSNPAEQLELTGNIRIPNTGNASGTLFKANKTFLHNAGTRNTFLGLDAGNLNLVNTWASDNTAVGQGSMTAIVVGLRNTAVGVEALYQNQSGSGNVAVGYQALFSQVANSPSSFLTCNTAVGSGALFSVLPSQSEGVNNTATGFFSQHNNIAGFGNTSSGYYSLWKNTVGSHNTAVGASALCSNTVGNENCALGSNALSGNIQGEGNIAVGGSALSSNISGNRNIAVGSKALLMNVAGHRNIAIGDSTLLNTTGMNNTAVGGKAGLNNTSGNHNSFFGYLSGQSNTTSNAGAFFGYGSGYSNTTGSNCSFFGTGSGYYNTTGMNNSFYGFQAGFNNIAGSDNCFFGLNAGFNNQISGNSFFGTYSGYSNIQGNNNSYFGYQAGYSNESGASNSFFGSNSGYLNHGNMSCFFGDSTGYHTNGGSYNSFYGYNAGNMNTTGYSNCFYGCMSGYNNLTSAFNSFYGTLSGKSNTNGFANAFFGQQTGENNTTGNLNAFFGAFAGYYNTTGSKNTFIGEGAGNSSDDWQIENSTAIGYQAQVNASNHMVLGNWNVESIGGYADWTILSDSRFKKDVSNNVKGLHFILKLNPVTYHLDIRKLQQFLKAGDIDEEVVTRKESILQSGFLAQEVEQAARESGYDFSGVDAPQNEKDQYGIRYAEFVVPLVKAVQEQQNMIEGQQAIIEKLQKEIEELKSKR